MDFYWIFLRLNRLNGNVSLETNVMITDNDVFFYFSFSCTYINLLSCLEELFTKDIIVKTSNDQKMHKISLPYRKYNLSAKKDDI